MASPVIDGTKVLSGPGILYYAPLATADTTDTVAGSVFTDAWPSGWLALGTTDDGSDFSDQITTENMTVAEALYPVKITTVSSESSLAFALAEINMTNFKRARNGGAIAATGSGATLKSTYTPPALGAEVRCMLGWQSLDDTMRLVCYQCFQTGAIALPFKKAPTKTLIPATFSLEQPATGSPYKLVGAGAVRG